ncbi:MAG: hypothetical protein MJK04_18780 [Psychrosphaera sp.]|nr:hypothetical protein [Psychrosphaera sp.]
MNLVVTLLIGATAIQTIDALTALLPCDGRPLFDDDEVKPAWLSVYQAIQGVFPPDELKRQGNLLYAQWIETDHSPRVLIKAIENTGAEVLFMQSCGELDGENDDLEHSGCGYLKKDGQWLPLTAASLPGLLPHSKLSWHVDVEDNTRQTIKYLMDRG